MKMIKITGCADSMRWYADLVGKTVEYCPRYDTETEYGSREPAGFVNFVMKTDGELVDIMDNSTWPFPASIGRP